MKASPQVIVNHFAKRGITVVADAGKLRFRPASKLDDGDKRLLTDNRSELVAYLSKQPAEPVKRTPLTAERIASIDRTFPAADPAPSTRPDNQEPKVSELRQKIAPKPMRPKPTISVADGIELVAAMNARVNTECADTTLTSEDFAALRKLEGEINASLEADRHGDELARESLVAALEAYEATAMRLIEQRRADE